MVLLDININLRIIYKFIIKNFFIELLCSYLYLMIMITSFGNTIQNCIIKKYFIRMHISYVHDRFVHDRYTNYILIALLENAFLDNNYIDRRIGRERSTVWLAYSPDLNFLDLWKHFNSRL